MTEPAAWRTLTSSLALVVLALFVMVLFQSAQLLLERGSLTQLRAAQAPGVEEIARARQQANQIASDTARLADLGNAGAKSVVDDFARQGITLKAQK